MSGLVQNILTFCTFGEKSGGMLHDFVNLLLLEEKKCVVHTNIPDFLLFLFNVKTYAVLYWSDRICQA